MWSLVTNGLPGLPHSDNERGKEATGMHNVGTINHLHLHR